jgi:SAM-dependent methyltransferase
MDLLRFAAPLGAGIAVLVPDDADVPALDGARVFPIRSSEAQDGDALLDRLRALHTQDRCELVIVNPADDSLAAARALIAGTFEELATGEDGAILYSLFERPPELRTGPDGLPLPPVNLVRLTSGARRQVHQDQSRVYRKFFESGEKSVGWIRDMVAAAGADLQAMGAILDFGCGCGRVLRHWRDHGPFEMHGCDYNPILVRWCAGHLAFAQLAVNGLHPPLPYEDDQFDLVYSFSIFTHFDEPMQRPWIEELARVTRPGGLVLITIHGPAVAARHLPTAAERERFAAGELVVRRADQAGRNACAAFHPPQYVAGELARGFDLLEHVVTETRGQDRVLLRVPG